MTNHRSPSVLGTLFRYEMRMLLRDTRTILIAIVAPLIMFPAYILVVNYVDSREQQALEEETYRYAVSGSRAGWAEGVVKAAIALDESDPDTSRAPVSFEFRNPPDPMGALEAGDIHVVVEGFSAPEWDSIRAEEREAEEEAREEEASGGEAAEADTAHAEEEPSLPAVRILYRGNSDFSEAARTRLRERILEVRATQRDSVLLSSGFPVAMSEVAPVEAESVASAAKASGLFLGLALTPFLVVLMLSGGSIVAVDAICGEKERGTLETLLTTAASRTDIVRAKLLAVIVVGLAVAVINVANLLVYIVLGVLDLPPDFVVEIDPLGLLLLLALLVPVAVLVAAALLLLSGASKSYREYQVFFFPVFVAFVVPSFAAGLPGIDLHSIIAVVPLAGVAVAVKEILVGEIDLPFQAFAFVSTAGLALWLTFKTHWTLSNEKLISGSDLDQADLTGGAALFPRHVLRWFLGLWVLFFLSSLWFGQDLGLRGQVVLNLLVIFFGGSLVMVRRYRLDPVEAYGLRKAHPAAWIAVLLGAPSALLVAFGITELVNTFVFPVPEQLLENFGQELLGPELPLWQLVLFLSVMPGIFEELFFRGILLHGLRRVIRRKWLLALTVGLIFGIFHVSLFRIVPTAWLGFILTWVVLFGGSIYPAMLWHALNNAIATVPATLGWLPEDFEPEAWWALPACLVLAFALWILWRTGPWNGTKGMGERSRGEAGTTRRR
ncbi:MAG: ABC transporter permease subunit [Gemmatimonadota bacterium]